MAEGHSSASEEGGKDATRTKDANVRFTKTGPQGRTAYDMAAAEDGEAIHAEVAERLKIHDS
ncbi:hypothetical protein AB0H45_24565 [Streptomyces atroolivaceus]|uniref:Uncharacterized protein n=1 Tax=Streptomyces atroolivaceus TaxID=66869 RepID=A0ABV9V2G2_STRAZ|nr:hypothetical protein [Streptomyces atroolivaceus]